MIGASKPCADSPSAGVALLDRARASCSWAAGSCGWLAVGAALPGLSFIGFAVVALRRVCTQIGQVHDTELTACGVPEPSRVGATWGRLSRQA
jgi:hypothetical protein